MADLVENPDFRALIQDADWQLESFTQYIRNTFEKKFGDTKENRVDQAVQNLLRAYLELARRYYDQFKESLKQAYLSSNDQEAVIDGAWVSAADVPILMQQAIGRLIDEWDRVYSIIMAGQLIELEGIREIVELLTPVVKEAIGDIGFGAEHFAVIPQFGSYYKMEFFEYADDFMALSLPLTALKSPWEWSIIWHEIAGDKVRQLKKVESDFYNWIELMFKGIKEEPVWDLWILGVFMILDAKRLGDRPEAWFEEWFMELKKSVKMDYASFIQDESTFLTPTSHIKKFLADPSWPLLMLSFEELFDDLMNELSSSNPETAKTAREYGWSQDWLEELFEDGFSVLSFDLNLLPIFSRLLGRYADGGKGFRHPPKSVRMATSLSLKLLTFEQIGQLPAPPQPEEWPSWQEMGLESAEELAAILEYDPGRLEPTTGEVVWLVAKKILRLHHRIKKLDSDTFIKKALSQAMKDYLVGQKPADIEKKTAATLGNFFSAEKDLDKTGDTPWSDEDKVRVLLSDRTTAGLGEDLQPLDYLQLLALPFTVRDYGNEVTFLYESYQYQVGDRGLRDAKTKKYIKDASPTRPKVFTFQSKGYWTNQRGIKQAVDKKYIKQVR